MNRAESNTAIMKQFEIMINTADEALSRKLISEKASFFTPASPVPLYGGKGYLSVVHWMRRGFSVGACGAGGGLQAGGGCRWSALS